MARQTFYTHPKFRRLCHILGEPRPHVLGCCELLWHTAGQSGDPVIGDAVDVELAAEYPGEPGRLAAALLEVRLLDRLDDGRLQVHDYFDHAPDYVLMRRQREQARKGDRTCERCGVAYRSGEPHAKFCSPKCRVASHRASGRGEALRAGTRGRVTETRSCVTETRCNEPPSPSPSLSPSLSHNTHHAPLGGAGVSGGTAASRKAAADAGFVAFWAAYPRKEAKQKAAMAFEKVAPSAELLAEILSAVGRQKRAGCLEPRATADGRSTVPHAATWLNGRRWEDEAQAARPGASPDLFRGAIEFLEGGQGQ